MADGSTKPIEHIQPGEQVLSVLESHPLGAPVPRAVAEVYHNQPARILTVNVGASVIRTTFGHLFFVRTHGWIKAASLRAGDQLRASKGHWATVTAVVDSGELENVFNLHVASQHTYFVCLTQSETAVLVHNQSYPPGGYTAEQGRTMLTLLGVDVRGLGKYEDSVYLKALQIQADEGESGMLSYEDLHAAAVEIAGGKAAVLDRIAAVEAERQAAIEQWNAQGEIRPLPGSYQDEIHRQQEFREYVRYAEHLSIAEKLFLPFWLPASVNPSLANFDNVVPLLAAGGTYGSRRGGADTKQRTKVSFRFSSPDRPRKPHVKFAPTEAQPASLGPTRSVYHKGELLEGRVGTHRELSTGVDRSSVNALDRPGKVHEFRIPEDTLRRWEFEGKVRRLRDYDHTTGTYNDELRFDPSLANELNELKVDQ